MIDGKTAQYRDRFHRIETDRRELAEDFKELKTEAKSAGFSKEEIAGIILSVKRSFETEEKRVSRITSEQVADALGDFANLPLGAAAVRHAA